MNLLALLCCFFLCLCDQTTHAAITNGYCRVTVSLSQQLQYGGCEELIQLSNATFTSYQCSSLEKALALVSSGNVTGTNCIEIRVSPGRHIVTGVYSIGVSLVLIGTTTAEVTFDFDIQSFLNSSEYEPLYVLDFDSVDYVGIQGIHFVNSPGIIEIRNTTRLEIENCTFRYFTEGAIDIYDSHYISVRNCLFENNGPVTNVLKTKPYSIHSGGVSITMNLPYEGVTVDPVISITNCQFVNNSAIPTDALVRSTNDIFIRNIFTGRGGGLGIALYSPLKTVTSYVENCLFEQNTAQVWGGGMYLILGNGSNHTVVTKANTFIDNLSHSGAGGLFTGSIDIGTVDVFSTILVKDSEFIGNKAEMGGATVWPAPGAPGFRSTRIPNLIRYENCTFIGNIANDVSCIALATVDPFNAQLSHEPVAIANCTFISNSAVDSFALSTTFVPILFEGRNIFDSNRGGAIELVGAIITMRGHLEISNSRTVGSNKAAFQISSFGQIMLYRGAEIVFSNNTGSLGAALIAVTQTLSAIFIKQIYNPLCFLLYENNRATPNEWTDVKISFFNNKAIVGAAAYTDVLDTCSWSQLKHPFFDNNQVLRWHFIEFGENTNTFHDADPTNPQWYVQTSAVTIDSVDNIIYAYPGEVFQLNISVLDELQQPVAVPVRALEQQTLTDFDTEISLQPEVDFFTNFSSKLNKRVLLHIGENTTGLYKVTLHNLFNLEGTSSSKIFINLKTCPPGFVLTQETNGDFSECSCNFNNSNIVTCMNKLPMFENSYWATTDPREIDQLHLYSCPYGYCRCFATENSPNECLFSYDSNEPDAQCNCNRNGVLCGECRNNLGVSALLNKCTTCHDAFSILIVALVVIDVVVLVVMLRFFLSAEYPDLLLPCIFYIQFLPHGAEVFNKDFQFIRPFLYYVSSALSFYFPYDFCLYSNMSTLVSYTLKFIPLVLVLTVTPVMLMISWRFIKRLRNKKWTLVWLLVLLIYNHSLHNSFNILNCPFIYINGTDDSRWYFDGTVPCFRGAHAPLGLLAILAISLCVAAIPISLVLSIKEFERPIWLRKLQSPLHIWFKERYKWWYSVELGRRLLLLIMIVPFPGNIYPVFIVYCLVSGLFMLVQPYATKAANWLDLFFAVNTLVLYFISIPKKPVLFQETSYVVDDTEGCISEVSTFSIVSILAGILYITPLVVTIIVLSIWISMKIYRHKDSAKKKIAARLSIVRKKRGHSEAVVAGGSSTVTYLTKTSDGQWIHGTNEPPPLAATHDEATDVNIEISLRETAQSNYSCESEYPSEKSTELENLEHSDT